jgi:hypothetical protein
VDGVVVVVGIVQCSVESVKEAATRKSQSVNTDRDRASVAKSGRRKLMWGRKVLTSHSRRTASLVSSRYSNSPAMAVKRKAADGATSASRKRSCPGMRLLLTALFLSINTVH